MNFDNLALGLLDGVSAVICFVLVWFMTKPYRYTGKRQYLGLPLGFSFLGASFVMGSIMLFDSAVFIDVVKWIQLFTQSYAFAFLAITYYYSKREKQATLSIFIIPFAAILFLALISYIIIFLIPSNELTHFDTVYDYLTIFNIICLTFIATYTLRSHAWKLDSKTIWIPLSYILFDFSQYSLLIWSLDSSSLAFAGAHFMRLAGLIVFLIVSYQVFYTSNGACPRKGIE